MNFSNAQSEFVSGSLAVYDKIIQNLTIQNLLRYIVEGFVVAIAAYVIPNKRTDIKEILIVSVIASLTLFSLDLFSSEIAKGTRYGAGFGIGYNLVNSQKLPFI